MADDSMRIVSLLPSITEIIAAVGLHEQLVGITHECDFPPLVVKDLSVVTTTEISPHTMSQDEINTAVNGSLMNGHSLYGLDEAMLAKTKATHVFTQALCDVCAVSFTKVASTCTKILGDNPHVVSLEPTSLEEVFTTISVVGKVCGKEDEAASLTATLRGKLRLIGDGE
eukprot:gene8731-10352_t